MWKVKEFKISNQPQELQVCALVKEMAEYSYATYAEAFNEHFKERVQEIPRKNIFSADFLYRITQRNLKSVELWKMDVKGDFKYKMMQLDYCENSK